MKKVTLKDIAGATGVHVSTVSRALDRNAQTSLTEEVVRRIKDTAERMGYRPNLLASGLRTKRSMTVGLVLPDITNTLFPPIVRGVESVLEPRGYASIIVNTDGLPDREAKLIDVLQERGVDGIIHAAAQRVDPKIIKVAAQGFPVVTVNRQIEGAVIPSVVNDDDAGIRMALEHLYSKGHRKIAHIAGPQPLSTGLIRLKAFVSKARALGLEVPKAATVFASHFDEEQGGICTEKLLHAGWPFTAILCANDRLALGAIFALRKHGITCPDDVSIIGFNDIPLLDLIPPRLTTIRIRQFDVGAIGAQILVRMMTEPDARIAESTVLPVELVERDSVGEIQPG